MLDDDLKEKFNIAGISHILVVSGTAIYILKKFLSKIFKRFKYGEYFVIIIIICYTIICNFSISILRAFLMYMISFILRKLKKSSRGLNILFTVIIILIINPYYIFNTSFWYSNLAVLGIMYIMPILNSKFRVIHLKLYRVRHEKYIKSKLRFKIEKYILNNISLTCSILIILFPLNIYLGNSINIFSAVTNLIINYIYFFEFIFGFILLLLFKIPFINEIICIILSFFTKVIIYIVDFFSSINIFSFKVNKLWFISIIILYIFIILLFFGYKIRFKLKYKFKSKRKFKVVYVSFIVFSIGVIILNFYLSYFSSFVYFFNIGQGNMSFVRTGSVNIVFDIGSSTLDVSNIFVSFLKAYNIDTIDYVFLSHMHSDHVNGLYNLKEDIVSGKVKIGKVFSSYFTEEMKNYLNELNINYELLKKGDKFENIEVLSPSFYGEIESKDIENASSMVTKININGKSILYMGDATKETEEKLINEYDNEYIYILQVGHHGSKTSTSKKFLEKFSFKNAVISSKKKVYGHPADITIENLYENNIKYVILEERGGVRFWL